MSISSLFLPVALCLQGSSISISSSHGRSRELALGLLKLCLRFGVVVLLGVVFGSLAVSPRDDSMDLPPSNSLLILICGFLLVRFGLLVVDVSMDGGKLSFIELDSVTFPV